MKKKRIVSYIAAVILLAAVIAGYSYYKGQTEKRQLEEAKKNEITGVEDLPGRKIGVQMGTTGDTYAKDYEGDESGTSVERFNKGTDAVQALKVGKIDCVIIDILTAEAFVEKNKELKILEEEFTNEDYAICVDKSNTELKEKINGALQELREDGTLQQISDYYTGAEEVKGKNPYRMMQDVKRDNGTLSMATNAEFPPYEYFDKGEIVGADVDMMQAVCDRLGMTLEIQNMEFDAIITAVESGKADVGAAGMTVTEDRLKSIDFTDSYTNSKQVIIVKDFALSAKKQSLRESLYDNFIKDNRYEYLLKGFGNTLLITLFAVLIGILLGLLIALVRTGYDRNGSMPVLNLLCRIYLTVVRGTPAVVQLLIIYYVILTSVHNKILVAVIAFGLNSAAYVAEVIRSGIMSVDIGQFEAVRSLGLNYHQTMVSIIIPQAVKNILPALCNEFIVLLKETSISGYIGLMDLTKGGDIIRSITYEAYVPLYAVALIYLVTVMLLSAGVNCLEKRLRKSER